MMKKTLVLHFAIFMTLSLVTETTIVRLTRDENIYVGQGVNFYCHIEGPVSHIILEGPDGINTAVICQSYKSCMSNYPGYLYDRVASNKTCVVFTVVSPARREEGEWICRDDSTLKTVTLTLLDRCEHCVNQPDRTTSSSVSGPTTITTKLTRAKVFHAMPQSTIKALTRADTPAFHATALPKVTKLQSEHSHITFIQATNIVVASLLYTNTEGSLTSASVTPDTVSPQLMTNTEVPQSTDITQVIPTHHTTPVTSRREITLQSTTRSTARVTHHTVLATPSSGAPICVYRYNMIIVGTISVFRKGI